MIIQHTRCGFYDSNITSPGFNETIHGFYASGTQHDIVADTQHTRGKSQSIVESDHTLRAQMLNIFGKRRNGKMRGNYMRKKRLN